MNKLDIDHLFSIGSQLSPVVNSGLRILLIITLAWIALVFSHKLIRTFRLYISKNFTDAEEVKRTATLGRVCRYIASVLISLITITLILSELGISIVPILGTAGVVGLACLLYTSRCV